MLLSIIVPVYNVEKYLARCLDSLVDQDLLPDEFEIIVVNDGSPDGSLAIAEQYKAKYPQIKIVSQHNQGLSEARNTGVREAKGEYINFVDSDDYVERNVYGCLMSLVKKHDLDFLGFSATNTPESNYRATVDFSPYDKSLEVYTGLEFIAKHNYLANAWWYIVRKKLLDDTGLVFEKGRILEDGMHTSELLISAKRVAYVKLDIYRYFLNMVSIMTTTARKNSERMTNDSFFIIERFGKLVGMAREKGANPAALRRLRTIREAYLFFFFLRMVRGNAPFGEFSKVIAKMEKDGVWPMRDFFGVDYTSKQERLLSIIFNNKFLLRLMLAGNSIFKIIK
ncbi:MAG: glycosyltransferase [Flavobacterium sp.]|uniref:glycosyltransferase n=1 Tax=Flavobacterium sp. TaxID=239 RepID=UPI001201BB77|nr:glycosyltransferase [Flavobacterium sp.]RZJ66063.1 MAG: glycosyltransferase [Flavobacterium sp.]